MFLHIFSLLYINCIKHFVVHKLYKTFWLMFYIVNIHLCLCINMPFLKLHFSVSDYFPSNWNFFIRILFLLLNFVSGDKLFHWFIWKHTYFTLIVFFKFNCFAIFLIQSFAGYTPPPIHALFFSRALSLFIYALFYLFIYLFIYLASLGLSCDMCDL